jgi:hypothetical protein
VRSQFGLVKMSQETPSPFSAPRVGMCRITVSGSIYVPQDTVLADFELACHGCLATVDCRDTVLLYCTYQHGVYTLSADGQIWQNIGTQPCRSPNKLPTRCRRPISEPAAGQKRRHARYGSSASTYILRTDSVPVPRTYRVRQTDIWCEQLSAGADIPNT